MTDRAIADRAWRIALLGAPIDMGASQRGTLMGPAALRTAGLATLLESLDFEVVDYGDLSVAEITDLADGLRHVGGCIDGALGHAGLGIGLRYVRAQARDLQIFRKN